MKKIYLSEAADNEFVAAIEFYRSIKPELGLEFYAAILKAIGAIQQFPKAQPLYDETYRHFILHKFPYHLIYLEVEDFILVDAVANAYRDRDYWRK